MDYVVAFKLTGVKPAGGTRTLWDNEAYYTLNQIADRAWNASVGLAGRSTQTGPSGLADGLRVEAGADGYLSVTVKHPETYSLSLRSHGGSLVSRTAGSGDAKFSLSGKKRGPGVYLPELRLGKEALTRSLVF